MRKQSQGQAQRQRQDRRQKRRGASAPIIQVEAPSYYDYQADAVAPIDFKPLLEHAKLASLEPNGPEGTFDQALPGLNGFSLAAEEPTAKALLSFYARQPRFIWVDGHEPGARALEALRVLSEADAFGLSPDEYAVALPNVTPVGDDAARLRELVRFEMTLSARVLRYLRDAGGGRIDPNRISGYHDFPLKPFDGEAELARMVRAKDIRAALEGAHPRMPEFAALKAELARLRATTDDWEPIGENVLLKPGQSSSELPKILRLIAEELTVPEHAELKTELEPFLTSETYSEPLVPVIKAVQEIKGLRPDGIIGSRTIEALAGISQEEQIEKVEIAMEQLRWHPRSLGDTRVFINQPAFTASYLEGGAEKLSMRVVIGTPANQTSFFYDEIEQVDYNPYWGVPQSILINEMLPRLRRDPGYLDRAGYEVSDSKGRRISSAKVNWWSYSPKSPLSVRQTPSEANALGELKILFPNKHAIYMHDTPAKDLFDKDERAFSHGCVRLHDPRGMAAAVLGTSVEHVAEKLEQGHSTEKVSQKIPVYVAYFTAWPDAGGTVRYFADIYERDKHIEAAIAETTETRSAGS
ncbi:MAG TPA: L,D-transpeptidase family protein [Mesorhizobium sp.]|nr:L,D-transpeptidase family protein [Mesorhizobium sp.]